MYSLQHGVNLSRRACRPNAADLRFVCLLLYVVSFKCAANPTQQPSTNSAGTYRPIAPANVVFSHTRSVITTDRNEQETSSGAYPGLQFGPMGPIDRTGALVSSKLVKHEPLQQHTTSTNVQKAQVERYKIMTFDFTRVETPFLIGLWIFCASLAKIGKYLFPNSL